MIPDFVARRTAQLCDLVVSTACAFHDGSGSIRWAMACHTPEKDAEQKSFLRDIHIASASIRNGYSLLIQYTWLMLSRIKWDAPTEDEQVVFEFWVAMGIAEESVAREVAKLHPRFRDGHLYCNAAFDTGAADVLDRVRSLFLYCLNAHTFTTSRFGTVVASCRGLAIALLWGVQLYVELIIAAGGSKWYIKGVRFLGG